jgi:hypothetical protein
MSTIRVEWVYAIHECETCGMSGADGAYVKKDGEELVDLTPHAACFDDVTFDDEMVYSRIIEALGLPLPDVDVNADDYVYDPARYAAVIRAHGHEIVETERRRI